LATPGTDCSTADTPVRLVEAVEMRVIADNRRAGMRSPRGSAWQHCAVMPVSASGSADEPRGSTASTIVAVAASCNSAQGAEAWLLMRNVDGTKGVAGTPAALASLGTKAVPGADSPLGSLGGAHLTRHVWVHVRSCSCFDGVSA
jgi:hypothetical protein